MSILQQVCDKMQEILRSLPDKAAVESGMLQRRRKLTGSALAEILVLGWLEHLKSAVSWASVSPDKPLSSASPQKPLKC